MERGSTGSCVNEHWIFLIAICSSLVLLISSFKRVYISSFSFVWTFRDQIASILSEAGVRWKCFLGVTLGMEKTRYLYSKKQIFFLIWTREVSSHEWLFRGWFRKTLRWVTTIKGGTIFDSETSNSDNWFCL